MNKTSSDDSIETSEAIPESSHSLENSNGFDFMRALVMWPVNYFKSFFDKNNSNEMQETVDVATLPIQENATSIFIAVLATLFTISFFEGDPNYSSDTTTQITETSKFSSKEHEDSNNEKAKLEMKENNTSEVNASFYFLHPPTC